MTRLLRALACSLLVTAAACSSAPPNITVHTGAPERPQLRVTGTATMQVSPDCADLTMTLTARGARPGAATAELRARQQALIAALQGLGVEDKDLALSTMGIQPVHEWILTRNVLKGYDARITLTVTTRAFDRLGALMEAGGDAGVTEMHSNFRRSDLASLKKQVREQALQAARAKGQQTAEALDITLGRIVGVSEESTSHLYSNAYFPRVANVNVQDAAAGPPPAIGGEMQPLTLDVTITYALPEPS